MSLVYLDLYLSLLLFGEVREFLVIWPDLTTLSDSFFDTDFGVLLETVILGLLTGKTAYWPGFKFTDMTQGWDSIVLTS